MHHPLHPQGVACGIASLVYRVTTKTTGGFDESDRRRFGFRATIEPQPQMKYNRSRNSSYLMADAPA